VSGFSQTKKLEKGYEYYEMHQYDLALDYFLSEENNLTDYKMQAELKVKIATCYFKTHKPQLAVINFEKAIKYKYALTPEQTIIYAQVLIETGNYIVAKDILEKLDAGMFVEEILLDKCEYALSNNEINNSVNIYAFKELPAHPSLGITFYHDNLLYILNQEQRNAKNNSAIFGYVGRHDKTIDDLNLLLFSENTNSPVINSKTNILYFSANSSFQSSKKTKNENLGMGGIDNLFIYELKFNMSKPIPEKLPFNNIDFSCTHPCLSNDGNTMYFSSNMLGGYGEFDIYVSKKTNKGWGSPQNMGTKINSFLNEGYPYVNGNYLYFSSDGHPGYGGLDIYRYNLETKEVENLGLPINSSYDDFYFIQNNLNEGFFVSNRLVDEASDIIFKFILKE
jgi:peptidoglycan-associated lipoprotein